MLNSSTAEVSTRFDNRRLSELPISPNRSVYNVLLSTPGVIQLVTGQAAFATGLSFSANGGRIRSNNFILDGQDMNDATFTGVEIALNNPDAIREITIITNQFKAEYGHNAASIVNVVGKSGTNNYHGSLFWYHNNEHLNACNNLDKVATGAPTGFCNKDAASDARKRAPRRNENQVGFTFGGPLTLPVFGEGGDRRVWKGTDKTFIFGDYQRWSDRSLVSGPTLNGAPTAAGRAVLQSVAGDRPQVQVLLRSLPAGIPNGTFATFVLPGQPPRLVELGDFTGSSLFVFDDHQGSLRLDQTFNEKNLFYVRYRFDSQNSSGGGQVTPPGLTTVNDSRSSALAIALNTVLTSRSSNDARLAWLQFSSRGDAEFPLAKTIPAITIGGLGIVGVNAQGTRVALGFPPNLPGFREHDTYQISDAFSYVTDSHSMKFGVELRRTDARLVGILNTRGNLNYVSPPPLPGQPVNISNFVNDIAQSATKNFLLAGGESEGFYRWHEFYAFAQDEWRIRDNLILTFGVRYEYPGDPFSYLRELNGRILAANGNNPVFRLGPTPETDANNLMPRIGFNWNSRTGKQGIIGFFTGGDKLVVSGGYSRTYDQIFMNLYANMALSFPFVATPSFSPSGAYVAIRDTTVPDLSQANLFARTVVSADIRSPATDQISIETQRELTKDLVMKIGYIRTRGTGLLQIVDGNPCLPLPTCTRVNPNLGMINLYTNAASSTYDALQASLTKRLSRSFSAGLHYTWSTLIDDVTDVFGASTSEFARSQDSFDRRADRARSGYDRPHRLTGNFVYELPFYQHQTGATGKLFGGWQLNSIFTFQSGAPFTVTLGADPTQSGNPIRPNLNTNLDLSSMTISEILAAGGAKLFREPSREQRVGNAGRNILRSDGLNLVDFGIIKNTRLSENVRIQFRADMFNSFNSRNFGIPNGAINSGANFLNQWATNGGNRRIVLGARLTF
jgi:TonB-dependent Receptor Plug Domain